MFECKNFSKIKSNKNIVIKLKQIKLKYFFDICYIIKRVEVNLNNSIST